MTLAPTLIASIISCAITGGIIPFIKIDGDVIKDKLDDAIDKVTDSIGDKVTEAIQHKIDSYEEEKNSLLAFKHTLAQLAESLDKPLVFIIDELDRCRPDFAIRLIERVKHFFDIPKIVFVFVLVMNKPQLLQSVKSFYGYDSEMNGDYLEKFIDFTIKFPEVNEDQLYEMVIKEQLYRIGELSNKEEVNEFYFWVLALQLEKKLNARELIKKLNQYALLRTYDTKNLILITMIFDSSFGNSLVFLNKMINVLFKYLSKGHNTTSITKSIFISNTLKSDFKISQFTMCEYVEDLESINENYSRHGQQDTKELRLKNYLAPFSVGLLHSSDNFINDWKEYIQTGVHEIN